MKRFSWYTDNKPHISTYLNGEPKKRYLVVDGIDVIGRAVMHYTPNRKGGHRQNHIYNACHRIVFRGKASRRIDRDDKPRFVQTFFANLRLNPQTLNDILKKKWRKHNDG